MAVKDGRDVGGAGARYRALWVSAAKQVHAKNKGRHTTLRRTTELLLPDNLDAAEGTDADVYGPPAANLGPESKVPFGMALERFLAQHEGAPGDRELNSKDVAEVLAAFGIGSAVTDEHITRASTSTASRVLLEQNRAGHEQLGNFASDSWTSFMDEVTGQLIWVVVLDFWQASPIPFRFVAVPTSVAHVILGIKSVVALSCGNDRVGNPSVL